MTAELFDHYILRLLAGAVLPLAAVVIGYIYWSVPRREKALMEAINTALNTSIQKHDIDMRAHALQHNDSIKQHNESMVSHVLLHKESMQEASLQIFAHNSDVYAHNSVLFTHNNDMVAHAPAFDRSLDKIISTVGVIHKEITEFRAAVDEMKLDLVALKTVYEMNNKNHRRNDPPDFDPTPLRAKPA